MAVAYGASGAIAYSTGNPAAAYPTGITAGQLLILEVRTKPDNTPATTPTGWTLLGAFSGGAGTTGIDTGPTRVGIFTKEADGTETGSLTVTVTGNNVSSAQIHRYTKTATNWDVAITGGADTAGGAAWSVLTGTVPAGWVAVGDILHIVTTLATDTNPTWGTETLTCQGGGSITLGAATVITTATTTSGQDLGGRTVRFTPTASTQAAGTLTYLSTHSGTVTNNYGPSAIVRIRDFTPVPPGVAAAPTVSNATAAERIDITAPSSYPSNATSWDLYQSVNGGTYLLLTSGVGLNSTVADTPLDATNTYTYRLRATGLGGSTDGTASAGIVPNPAPPSYSLAPSSNTVTVNITKRNYVAVYKVYRGLAGGARSLVHTSTSQTAGGVYSWDDTGVTNGTAYDYHVTTNPQTPTARESSVSTIRTVTPMPIAYVTTGTDDGYDSGGTSFSNSATSGTFGNFGTTMYTSFFRIQLPVAKGSVINSAALNLVATSTTTGTPTIRASAFSSGNAAAPTTSGGLLGPVRTTAFTDTLLSGVATGATMTFDVASVLQEIVNRSDWVSGNYIVLVLTGVGTSGSNSQTWAAQEHTTYADPNVTYSYTPPTLITASDTLSASVTDAVASNNAITYSATLRRATSDGPQAWVVQAGNTSGQSRFEVISDNNDTSYMEYQFDGTDGVQTLFLDAATPAPATGLQNVARVRYSAPANWLDGYLRIYNTGNNSTITTIMLPTTSDVITDVEVGIANTVTSWANVGLEFHTGDTGAFSSAIRVYDFYVKVATGSAPAGGSATPINASDTLSASVTDTSALTILNLVVASDTLSAAVTDTGTFATVAVAASDTLSAAVADSSAGLKASLTASDATSAAVTESVAFAAIPIAATDTPTAAVTDSFSAMKASFVGIGDNVNAAVTESVSFATITVTATDTLSAAVTDLAATFATAPAADALTVMVTETSQIDIGGLVTKSASDTVTAAATESVAQQLGLATSDTLAAAVSDLGTFGPIAITASDTFVATLGIKYADDFNRASLGANWHTTTTPVTLDGTQTVASAAANAQRWAANTATDNQVSQAVYKGGNFIGVAVAMGDMSGTPTLTAAPPFYLFRQQGAGAGTAICIKPNASATPTALATDATNLTTNDAIRLEYNNGVLTAFVNNVPRITHTPSSPITGQRGVGFAHGSSTQTGTALLDDWAGGDIGETTAFGTVVVNALDQPAAGVFDNASILLTSDVRSASDTLSASVTDVGTFATVAASATDTPTAAVTESVSFGTVSVSASDTLSGSVTDQAFMATAGAATDNLIATVSENNNIVITGTIVKTASDSIVAQVAESTTTTAALNIVDDLSVNLVDATQNVNISGTVTKSAFDNTSLSVTDTAAILSSFASSDTLTTTVNDTYTFAPVQVVGNDTLTTTLNDQGAFSTLPIVASDTLSASVTDSGVFSTVNVTANDTPTVQVTDTGTFATVAVTASDSLSAAVTDNAALETDFPGADFLYASVFETSQVVISGTVNISASDNLSAAVTETVTDTAGLTTTDTLTAAIVDSGGQMVARAASDTLTGTLSSELAQNNIIGIIVKTAGDTLSVNVTDTSALNIHKDLIQDSLVASVTETVDLQVGGLILVSAFDAPTAAVTESVSFGTVSVSASDTVQAAVNDTSGFAPVAITASDTPFAQVTEQISFATVTLSSADSLNAAVTETDYTVVPEPAADTLAMSVTETSNVVASGTTNISASDTLSASVTETRGLKSVLSAADNLDAKVTDAGTFFSAITVTASDTLAVSVVDILAFSTTTVTANDALTASVQDDRSVFLTNPGQDQLLAMVTETSQVVQTGGASKSGNDTLAVSVTETTAVKVLQSAFDLLYPEVTDDLVFEATRFSTNDLLQVNLADTLVFGTTIVIANDVLIATLSETAVPFNSRPGEEMLFACVTETTNIVKSGTIDFDVDDTLLVRVDETASVNFIVVITATDDLNARVTEVMKTLDKRSNREFRGSDWIKGFDRVYRNGRWTSVPRRQ